MKNLTFLCLVLVLCSSAFSAQVIRYVDTDSAAGGNGTTAALSGGNHAYQSLSAWNTAEGTNLDSANNYHTVYCAASAGAADTTAFNLTGWTTSATDYIEVRGSDFPADGIWSDTAYRMTGTNVQMIRIYESYVRFHNLQFYGTATGSSSIYCLITDNGITGASVHYIDSCIFKCTSSTTGEAIGVYTHDVDEVEYIYNCTFQGFVSGADTTHYGGYEDVGIANYYNCTFYDCYFATNIGSDGTVINCIGGNITTVSEFGVSTGTIDYCMADTVEGTNGQRAVSLDWDNELTDANNGDFRLVGGGNWQYGTDDPSLGIYSDDIIGTSRTSTWSIGAYEEAAASGSDQVMIISNDFWGKFLQEGINGKWKIGKAA